jgi:hypothetical protein
MIALLATFQNYHDFRDPFLRLHLRGHWLTLAADHNCSSTARFQRMPSPSWRDDFMRSDHTSRELDSGDMSKRGSSQLTGQPDVPTQQTFHHITAAIFTIWSLGG